MGRWWGKTTIRHKNSIETQETEIDLLAVSANGDQYLLGECKFKGRPFRYGEYLDTLAKLTLQKDKAEFYYYLFSESGFDEKLTEEAQEKERITLIGLDRIVKLQ